MKINISSEQLHDFVYTLSNRSQYRSARYIRIAGINIKLLFHSFRIEEYGMGQLKFLEKSQCTSVDYTLTIIEDDFPWEYCGSVIPFECIRYLHNGEIVFYNYTKSPNMVVGRYNGEIFIIYRKIENKEDFSIKLGHFLHRVLAGLVKSNNSYFIHGGCISYKGKGLLLCGKGGSGKSTLAATALLSGWEYAAEDYLILTKKEDILHASPTYSTLNLSEEMLEKLPEFKPYDLGYRGWREKHFIDISSFIDQLRYEIPINAIVLPCITKNEQPSFERISPEKPLLQLIYSTVRQTATEPSEQDLTVALASILRGIPTYQLNLTENLHENLAFLESVMDII